MAVMYDPSMRVLTILEILQAKERVSAGELANRLEVSSRTVQRYIARLQDLGVPVSSSKGRGASYRLKPSYRMPPIMFSNEEAFAIALGLNALQHIGLSALAPAVVGVEAKLERVLPTTIWARMQALSTALQLEKTPWIVPVQAGLVAEISRAIQEQRQLEMQYENQRQLSSQRTVQPLGLVRDGSAWFLVAYCLMRQDIRLFRVDRIGAVQVSQVLFQSPADFNVREFAKTRLQNIPATWRVEVWFDATPETLRYDLIPPRTELTQLEDGFVLRCGVNNLVSFAARLLEFGCAFQIRQPSELKAAFKTVAERAMKVFEE
jgi:predicted DNA-binding transcriptional regulator YafY